MKLLEPFSFQGYELFVNNFYSSLVLFESLMEVGIRATGTLRINRRSIPDAVIQLKTFLELPHHAKGHNLSIAQTYPCKY